MPVPSLTDSPVEDDVFAPASPDGKPVMVSGPAPGARLEVKPNYPFGYCFYPDEPSSWFVGEIEAGPGVSAEEVGFWWLPKLTYVPEKPGLDNFRTLSRGEPAHMASRLQHQTIEDRGGFVLPKLIAGRPYVQAIPCIDPFTKKEGDHYVDVWSKPRKRRPGQYLKWDFDRQRFYRFLLLLLRQDIIKPPSDDVMAYKREKLAARVVRREQQYDLDETARAKLVAENQARLQTLMAASVVDRPEPSTQPLRKRAPHMLDGE